MQHSQAAANKNSEDVYVIYLLLVQRMIWYTTLFGILWAPTLCSLTETIGGNCVIHESWVTQLSPIVSRVMTRTPIKQSIPHNPYQTTIIVSRRKQTYWSATTIYFLLVTIPWRNSTRPTYVRKLDLKIGFTQKTARFYYCLGFALTGWGNELCHVDLNRTTPKPIKSLSWKRVT